jgi:hypothetical protein
VDVVCEKTNVQSQAFTAMEKLITTQTRSGGVMGRPR